MARRGTSRTGTLVREVLDRAALGRRETLLAVTARLAEVGQRSDILTILAEIFSNALRHGAIERLVITARRRRAMLCLAFAHTPPLAPAALDALSRAASGALPRHDALAVGGRGFPLLCRLARTVSISADRTTLRLWLSLPPAPLQPDKA